MADSVHAQSKAPVAAGDQTPQEGEASSPGLLAGKQRLVSLDVFRGLVILAMLVVNNLGDYGQVGYWFKHANWIEGSQWQAYRAWFASLPTVEGVYGLLGLAAQFPLFHHVTLADYVMPWFILIIGIAMPFSVASSFKRNEAVGQRWWKTLRRVMMLIILGWAIDASLRVLLWYHSSNPDAELSFTLGMNVLQLLGVSYLVARIIYVLPRGPRFAVAGLLLVGHWALLRFYPQPGGMGLFTAEQNAVAHLYKTWSSIFYFDIPFVPRLGGSLRGMLSVPPTAATMVLGTWIGELVRRKDLGDLAKVKRLFWVGAAAALVGFLWAFSLTFNKPVWTPAYLVYCSGVGAMLIGLIYWIVDIRGKQWWVRPFVVFGMNSIAVYWLSIMFKIWVLNMPKVPDGQGGTMMMTAAIVQGLQGVFGKWGGSWAFTLLFIGFWWLVMDQAYRRRIFWKL